MEELVVPLEQEIKRLKVQLKKYKEKNVELLARVEVLEKREEHQRLADAASELIEAMDPNAWGDMPEILCRMAKQVRESKNK
jgi:hypothetical protein